MSQNEIVIRGAREHNLKNVDITLPRDKMIVISGVSGSGKSSLAFDTIYAEGQRRYVESLSSYARMFLGQMEKPDLDYIGGLSPAIAIEQKTTARNPRSTVATVTEIYDYLRLLFARIGEPYCYKCGKKIDNQSIDQIVDVIYRHEEGCRLMIMAPVARNKKGEFQNVFADAIKAGYSRVIVDGEMRSLDEKIELEKNIRHTIYIVVDRIKLRADVRKRLVDSIETSLKITDGLLAVDFDGQIEIFSTKFACPDCGISYPEIQPRIFSFNSPLGACPNCNGIGETSEYNINKIIPDQNLSLNEGAILTHLPRQKMYFNTLQAVSKHFGINLDAPFKDLSKEHQNIIINGSPEEIDVVYTSQNGKSSWGSKHPFGGILNELKRRYRETGSSFIRDWLTTFMTVQECSECQGKRLAPVPLSVKINGKNIYEVTCMNVTECLDFIQNLTLNETQKLIADQILKELVARLKFLSDVGLQYLTLDRKAATLSGGEAQRIRLATQIGSRLVGVLYILDEPTIGLHQRDNDKLLSSLMELRDLGNTLVVVEHDEQVIRSADYVVEMGPLAGELGGEVIAKGTVDEIIANEKSITGQYLSGKEFVPIPKCPRPGNGKFIEIIGANLHNIHDLNVKIPLEKLTVVTGVSGSGKSTLINDILFPVLCNKLNRSDKVEVGFKEIRGYESLDKVINIDQSPIGRSPRSNPVTYVEVFGAIRNLFASLEESKYRGYAPGRFSFNTSGGRCEHCQGDGVIKTEMHFLPDIYVKCDVCKGRRYNRETLEVKYKGYSIADVLEMTIDQACELFEQQPPILRKLKTLQEVGLGYIRLGQSSLTLSGGEAQRVKLALELSKPSTGKTIYILDEPTTGLHFADVKQLIGVLQRLVSNGNTMIIIEHNLDVIKVADHIIDLGPEGGTGGGQIVAEGTVQEIANNKNSYTGQYLKKILEAGK